MYTKDKTAVVILNWNGKQFLEIFLGIIIARSPEAEIWVADNGSNDDSISFLKSNFADVHILEFDKNYGYTGGYNRAISEIDADYYVLLNSDIEVTEGWLQPLISMMSKDPDVAAIQPKVLSFAEKNRFEYAGASGGFIDILGYPFCRGRFIGQKTEIDNGQYNDSREIFWATGAALMVRGNLFKQYGGLDDNFFAHMEEIDLCWRLKRAGYKIMVEPKSYVYHVGGGTLPVWSPQKTYLNFRNNISMLYKNMPIRKFGLIYFIRIQTDLLRAFSYLLQFKLKFTNAVIKGHIDFWKNRNNLNRHNEIGHKNVSCIYNGSIVMKKIFGKGVFGNMMTLLIILNLLACSGQKTGNLIKIEKPLASVKYTIGERIDFSIVNTTDEKPDSIVINVDGKIIKDNTYITDRVGSINYIATAYKDGIIDVNRGTIGVITNKIPSIRKISIIESYPHSTDSYTQGLIFRNNLFYESVGEYNHSALKVVEPATGKTIKETKLAKNIFAEGLEEISGKLYQLSWREKTCFQYDISEINLTNKFSYQGEGWGLATDGNLLYMSDGTSRIRIISPDSFRHIGNIDVLDQRGEVNLLNELEWIDGKIWANIYQSNWIAIINPKTGEVESYIDCSILDREIKHSKETDVLNGIAYDKEGKNIYLTGKKWDRMFLIKLN